MNRIASAVLWSSLALLPLVACAPSATASPAKSSPSTGSGKPTAPVSVDAQLGAQTARVTIRFDAPASAVQVNVHGVDGLVVTSEQTPVNGGSFEQGSTATFDVAFTPGPGRSHLVVAVTGAFRGAQQSRVSSFAVGTPTDAQRNASSAEKTDSNGERIKIMPVGQQ